MDQADRIRSCGTGVPPVRRRRKLAVWLILLASLAIWCGRFAYLRITLRPTPRPEYWEAQLAALDPPPVGAITTSEAFEILTDRPWESHLTPPDVLQYMGEVVRGRWDESRKVVAAAVAVFESDEFDERRARLEMAVNAGWRDTLYFSPVNARWTLVRHYRAWRRWLATHARWSLECNGDAKTAVDDWLMILKMGRQARRAASLAAFGVDTAAVDLVAVAMACAVTPELNTPLDSRLLAMQIDEILGPALSAQDLVAGERLCMHALLDQTFVREGGDWLDVSEAGVVACILTWVCARPAPSRTWNLASPLFHDLPTARACIDRAAASVEQADTLAAARRTHDPALQGPLGALDGFAWFDYHDETMAGPAFAIEGHYEGRTRLDASLTLLALHEFRSRNGRYPAALAELVPDYLPRLPVDYADRQTLRYRLSDDGFVLYSIGADGKDDGGRCARPGGPWRAQNADAVFRVMSWEEVPE